MCKCINFSEKSFFPGNRMIPRETEIESILQWRKKVQNQRKNGSFTFYNLSFWAILTLASGPLPEERPSQPQSEAGSGQSP